MRKFATFFFILVTIFHFLILYCFGIATFTTTLLFYVILYWFFKLIIYSININANKKIILVNIKAILIICLLAEFSCTFIFKILNNPVENEKGIYLSPYMKDKQINILYNLGIIKNKRNTWQNGYAAFYQHRYFSKDFNYEVGYNEYGFRGKFPPVKKDSDEYRILCLGDSFVEGFGTSEDSTFPKLLQNYIQSDDKKISILNGGICGSNPYNEIKLYKNKLKAYNPDLVIIEINNGDIYDSKFVGKTEKLPINEYFYAISHLYRIIDGILEKADLHFNIKIGFFDLFISEEMIIENEKKEEKEKGQNERKKMIENLIYFQQQLLNEKKELVIIYLPMQNELFKKENSALKKELLKQKISFIDLQKAYEIQIPINADSLQTYYWKNDGHHTPKGYNLMAKIVAQKLYEEKYLKNKKIN